MRPMRRCEARAMQACMRASGGANSPRGALCAALPAWRGARTSARLRMRACTSPSLHSVSTQARSQHRRWCWGAPVRRHVRGARGWCPGRLGGARWCGSLAGRAPRRPPAHPPRCGCCQPTTRNWHGRPGPSCYTLTGQQQVLYSGYRRQRATCGADLQHWRAGARQTCSRALARACNPGGSSCWAHRLGEGRRVRVRERVLHGSQAARERVNAAGRPCRFRLHRLAHLGRCAGARTRLRPALRRAARRGGLPVGAGAGLLGRSRSSPTFASSAAPCVLLLSFDVASAARRRPGGVAALCVCSAEAEGAERRGGAGGSC